MSIGGTSGFQNYQDIHRSNKVLLKCVQDLEVSNITTNRSEGASQFQHSHGILGSQNNIDMHI